MNVNIKRSAIRVEGGKEKVRITEFFHYRFFAIVGSFNFEHSITLTEIQIEGPNGEIYHVGLPLGYLFTLSPLFS